MVKVVDCARIQRLQAGCVHRIGCVPCCVNTVILLLGSTWFGSSTSSFDHVEPTQLISHAGSSLQSHSLLFLCCIPITGSEGWTVKWLPVGLMNKNYILLCSSLFLCSHGSLTRQAPQCLKFWHDVLAQVLINVYWTH